MGSLSTVFYVTGFGPFDSVQENPTEKLVKLIQAGELESMREEVSGVEIASATVYETSASVSKGMWWAGWNEEERDRKGGGFHNHMVDVYSAQFLFGWTRIFCLQCSCTIFIRLAGWGLFCCRESGFMV